MDNAENIRNVLRSVIGEMSKTPEKFVKNPGKDMIRNRKLGFSTIISLMLTMEGDCTKEEIYRYFGRTEEAPSKAAWFKQRNKLSPETLPTLMYTFNEKLHTELFDNRYELLACDGSALDIYRNPNDPDTFFEPNGKSTRGFNQVHINCMYSILDQRFRDIIVQPSRKRNEYAAFCDMVDSIGKTAITKIYFADMGYASYNNFAHVIENGQYFLIRCNDRRLQGILGHSIGNLKEMDSHIDLMLTRTQSKKKHRKPELETQYRFVCAKVPIDYINDDQPEYPMSLRVVRFELKPGCYENIITNLPDAKFSTEDFPDLYHLRWNEETSFRNLKYPLCLKELHSKKYEYIVQEIWARAILHNFSTAIIKNVKINDCNRKYKYQVNEAEALKICRDYLRGHGEGNPKNVEAVIADNIEPIRGDRSYQRIHRFKLPISFCYRN